MQRFQFDGFFFLATTTTNLILRTIRGALTCFVERESKLC